VGCIEGGIVGGTGAGGGREVGCRLIVLESVFLQSVRTTNPLKLKEI
jgi:hypothetical protein